MSEDGYAKIVKFMEDYKIEVQKSLGWYYFKIEPLYQKYKTNIDGIFIKRIWWFLLREIK